MTSVNPVIFWIVMGITLIIIVVTFVNFLNEMFKEKE